MKNHKYYSLQPEINLWIYLLNVFVDFICLLEDRSKLHSLGPLQLRNRVLIVEVRNLGVDIRLDACFLIDGRTDLCNRDADI